jgi:hypothetical protein
MLSWSRSYHLSRRSGVPGFDVLAQPLSARQKLDSFLLHRVVSLVRHILSLRFATKLFLELRIHAGVLIFMSLRVSIYQLDDRDKSLVSQFGTRLASRETGAGQLNASKVVETAV